MNTTPHRHLTTPSFLPPNVGEAGTLQFFPLGLIYGLTITVSTLTPYHTEFKAAGACLLVWVAVIFLFHHVLASCISTTGLLFLAFAFVSIIAGMASAAEPAAILKFMLLCPVAWAMLAIRRRGEESLRRFRMGITVCGLAFSLIALAYADFALMEDPKTRLTSYANPNFIGFLAAMSGISAFDLAGRKESSLVLRWLFFFCFVGCIVACFTTKSRTATLSFLMGTLALCTVRYGLTRMMMASFFLVPLVLFLPLESLFERFSESYSLFEGPRKISEATGRFTLWANVIRKIWWANPFLGIGPDQNIVMTWEMFGSRGAHNGLLAVLTDLGIVGVIPVLWILLRSARVAIVESNKPEMAAAIGLFVGGFVESLGEIQLLSIGNSGSVLFLISIVALDARARERAASKAS